MPSVGQYKSYSEEWIQGHVFTPFILLEKPFVRQQGEWTEAQE